MKIKTVKKMRLDELLKHVWHEGGGHKTYMSNEGKSVDIDDSGIQFLNDYKINSGIVLSRETFTVEVEEELTEATEVHGATLVYYNEPKREIKPFRYADVTSPTLKHIIQPRSGTVALAVFKGKQLIWTKEHGIPESGVLEVDVK